MTPAEAAAKVSLWFTTHETAGLSTDYVDQNDKVVGSGARDMSVAPNGEMYEVLTSYGVDARLPEHALVLFQNEGLALQWWLDEVEAYAADVNPDRDNWKRLHLYWRDKPSFHKTTFLAMNQAELLQTASPLAAVHQLDMGFVWSRLLISRTGPDGEES